MLRQVLTTLGWRRISRPRDVTGSWLWLTVPNVWKPPAEVAGF